MRTVPRLSIGFPVYNSAPTVREALGSLLAQTFMEFELIVSDNASTDETLAVCREIAARDGRVRVMSQKSNEGPFANFAAVLAPARGEYFMWAAGDDLWHPRFIERCVTTLDARPDVGVVFPRARITSLRIPYVSRTRLPHLSFVDSDDVFERVCDYIDMPASSHKANAIYGVWRTELARRTIDAVGTIDPRMVYRGLDIAMMAYVLTQTKMAQLPEVLFEKRSKWFPSGSTADRLVSGVVMLVRPHQDHDPDRDHREHVALIRTLLQRAGVYDERYERVLQEKLERKVV